MRTVLFILPLLFICSAASADMIEIKGEGIYNGTIESENEKEVVFRGAKGDVRTLPKKDILFMERQAEPAPAAKAALKAGQVLKAPKAGVEQALKAPKKLVKGLKVPAPPAKKREAPAASGGDPASDAMRAVARAQRAAAANDARVKAVIDQALDGGPTEGRSEKSDGRKKHFASLSDG